MSQLPPQGWSSILKPGITLLSQVHAFCLSDATVHIYSGVHVNCCIWGCSENAQKPGSQATDLSYCIVMHTEGHWTSQSRMSLSVRDSCSSGKDPKRWPPDCEGLVGWHSLLVSGSPLVSIRDFILDLVFMSTCQWPVNVSHHQDKWPSNSSCHQGRSTQHDDQLYMCPIPIHLKPMDFCHWRWSLSECGSWQDVSVGKIHKHEYWVQFPTPT